MDVSAEQFRTIFAALPSTVAVVTAADDDEPYGFTCNTVCAVSRTPPMLLICVDRSAQTLPALHRHGAFAVNFLCRGRGPLGDRFAGKAADKFEGVRWEPSAIANGAPLLTGDTVATVECRVRQSIEAGDHWIFVAAMHRVDLRPGEPLTYYRREYDRWPAAALVRS